VGTTAHGLSQCIIKPELIPECVREDIGRVGLDTVIKFYQNPENERRFQEWLVEYRKRPKVKRGGKRKA